MTKIEELQTTVKNYQESNGVFSVVDLKFHNKWNQEFSLRTYLKNNKRYISTSAATSCICEPGLQENFKKTSYDANLLREWKGCTIGTALHLLADGTLSDPSEALQVSMTKNVYPKEKPSDSLLLELILSITKAYNEYLRLFPLSKMITIANEVTFFNDQLHVAGTVDRIVAVEVSPKQYKFGIVDWKTGNTTNGVSVESKMSCYKFLAEPILKTPLFFSIFDLPKDPEDKNGYFFTYAHYDLNLDSFLGALAIFKVAHWKQLKTFWPGWDERIKSILDLNHKSFEDEEIDTDDLPDWNNGEFYKE